MGVVNGLWAPANQYIGGDNWKAQRCWEPFARQHVWGEGSNQARAISLP